MVGGAIVAWRIQGGSIRRHELSMGRENTSHEFLYSSQSIAQCGGSRENVIAPVIQDITELLVLEFRELAQSALFFS